MNLLNFIDKSDKASLIHQKTISSLQQLSEISSSSSGANLSLAKCYEAYVKNKAVETARIRKAVETARIRKAVEIARIRMNLLSLATSKSRKKLCEFLSANTIDQKTLDFVVKITSDPINYQILIDFGALDDGTFPEVIYDCLITE